MVKRIIYIISVILGELMLPYNVFAQKPSVFDVKRMSFNSGYFNEISPVITKEGVAFCSDRRLSGIKDRTSYEGTRLFNMFMAERIDTSEWRKPKVLKTERSSKFNNGPFSISSDGKTVYFTSEVETGKAVKRRNFRNHSGIFVGELAGTELVSLSPFKYNSSDYEVGQPSVSNDGKLLFFASDMPGGRGGSDIYYCEFINGEWSAPLNMGPKVNSAASENYPYIHPTGRLYFTSNRDGGIGMLDVYSTAKYLDSWDDPVLLPEPVNSSSDDFAFVAESNQQTGYFSSNRASSDDIYKFVSTIIRKESCNSQEENSYCYRFQEENAVKFDTLPFRYEWKFGDGQKGIGAMVEHCYTASGTYLVQLDVVNLLTKEIMYNEKSDTLVVEEIEQPYITSPENAEPGKMIRMDAAKTNLPGWNISQYYWNFGDETIQIGREVDKAYLKPGSYNIQLIVTTEPEPGGMAREACISKNITIAPLP